MNVLRGNVQLSSSERQKLKRYKRVLRKLADKHVSLKHKIHILQTGGFLASLLGPLALSVLGPVVKSLLK